MLRFIEEFLFCEAVGTERETQRTEVLALLRRTLLVAFAWIGLHAAATTLGPFSGYASAALIVAAVLWLVSEHGVPEARGRVVGRYADRQQIAILAGLVATSFVQDPETAHAARALVQACLVVALLLPWTTAVRGVVRRWTRTGSAEFAAYLAAALGLLAALAAAYSLTGRSLGESFAELSLPARLLSGALAATAPLLLAWGSCRADTPERARVRWEQEAEARRAGQEAVHWARIPVTQWAGRASIPTGYSAACVLWILVALADVTLHALL